MRRVDLLITASRQATENTNFSSGTGLQDDEFIQYLNDAQDRIYGSILSVYPSEFLVQKLISAVIGTSAYTIPTDAYLGSKIKLVEYSVNGQEVNYYPVDKATERERFHGNPGNPRFYIRRSNQIVLNPAPSTLGTIRVTYFQKVPRLDQRRGKVLSVTLDTVNLNITALTLDPVYTSSDNMTAIQDNGYMTVVDKDGAIQMQNIPISSIDTSTGLVTLDGSFTYLSTETISVGNWVVTGKNTSTHSSLDDACERYLLAHCNWKILKRDSSNDSLESSQELTSMLLEIVEIYKDADDDVDGVTILDTDYLTY